MKCSIEHGSSFEVTVIPLKRSLTPTKTDMLPDAWTVNSGEASFKIRRYRQINIQVSMTVQWILCGGMESDGGWIDCVRTDILTVCFIVGTVLEIVPSVCFGN